MTGSAKQSKTNERLDCFASLATASRHFGCGTIRM
jgi:hypothetical protein